ncbi:MAG: Ig-like domain-containing protein, partial [Actinomycetota bacterium]
MGRRTHPPRAAAFVAAAIVFSVTVLGSTSASAAVPTVTRTITPSDPNGSNGWYNSGMIDVTLAVDVQGGTEISRSGECDTTIQVTSDTAGRVVTCSIETDGGTASDTVTIKRDATNPSLNPQISPATLVLNGPGTAAPNATDATSGIDQANTSCGAVNTNTIGAHSLQCTATDMAGNQVSEMVPYTVQPNGPAASVAATKGDGQVAYVTRQFASSLVVTVTDAQGNPVPGETVTFRAPLSGPSADLSRLTDVTNGNGVTSIRAFANNKVGGYVVTGKIKGIGTARFDLRNAAAPYFADGFSRGL